MSPVQTTYLAEHPVAIEGQRANFGLYNSTSKVAEGSDINFARAVVRGTADNQAKLPSAAGQGFLGITQYTTAWSANGSDEHLYEQYREMNIMDEGYIWMTTEQAVVPGDKVYFRHTAAGAEVIGALRKDSDGGDAELIPGASFESTASAAGLALVRLTGNRADVAVTETIVATSGAISIDTLVSLFDTTAGASTATLADGEEQQRKILKMTVDGGDQVVTPANLSDGTTLTFADANDSVELIFSGSSWHVVSNNGVVIA